MVQGEVRFGRAMAWSTTMQDISWLAFYLVTQASLIKPLFIHAPKQLLIQPLLLC